MWHRYRELSLWQKIEIDPSGAKPNHGAKPHSVLTINLRDDDPQGATKRAETRVIEFFQQRLQSRPSAQP